jgi:hypothetical protein
MNIPTSYLPRTRLSTGDLASVTPQRADRDDLKSHAEAVQEHRAVEKTVLPDVHAAEITTPQFAGRVKVFGEMIDHHATEEETTLFRMARKLFTARERAELDVAYEEWKASPAAAAASAMAEAETGLKAMVRRVTRRAQ